MARAFIIRPFGKKEDSDGREIDFDRIQEKLIDPALEIRGLDGGTTGEVIDAGNIREDMFALILEADLVVCDITVHNANVFYELGIRHALRRRTTILLRGRPTADDTPFDLLTDRYLAYDIDAPEASVDQLAEAIAASLGSDRTADSPVFEMLPMMPEVDPEDVQVVPLAFREEVERAKSARSPGWLRLLSKDVQGCRFEWSARKQIGQAQWDLKDYLGARESWETVREFRPRDIDANLALANVYERLHREDEGGDWLIRSDQAIERALGSDEAQRTQRAEALALAARNQKTRWRARFESEESQDARRQRACDRVGLTAYELYLNAFREDITHFYPGLAALQQGSILLDLAKEDAWLDTFDSDEEANRVRERLQSQVDELTTVIPFAVETALGKLAKTDGDRCWAEISEADCLFLRGERPRRVIKAYRNAVPDDKPFAWDAVRRALELFENLGIHADLASKALTTLADEFPSSTKKLSERPLHLVVFAGHQIDGVGRPTPRFPAVAESKARQLIRAAVEQLNGDDHELLGMSSAAPGGDILFHEICAELDIKSTICLPVPQRDFAANVLKDDEWRARFLDLAETRNVLELSNQDDLPRWLVEAGIDKWERGNRWVMEMAQTQNAARITLIALWDGKPVGDARGGTAQMVALARGLGTIRVELVDASALLATAAG